MGPGSVRSRQLHPLPIVEAVQTTISNSIGSLLCYNMCDGAIRWLGWGGGGTEGLGDMLLWHKVGVFLDLCYGQPRCNLGFRVENALHDCKKKWWSGRSNVPFHQTATIKLAAIWRLLSCNLPIFQQLCPNRAPMTFVAENAKCSSIVYF